MESEERLTEKFYRASTVFYWIVVNQEKVGFLRVVTSPEEKSIWLSPLLILPEFQKKGYASQAMRRIEEYYPTFIRWTLATIFQEKHLVRFYESLGYQIFKRENEQLGMDIVYMEKKK